MNAPNKIQELNDRAAEIFIEEIRLRIAGKSWAEIMWEEEEEEERKEMDKRKAMEEKRKVMDAARKKEWIQKNYDAEEGEIFE